MMTAVNTIVNSNEMTKEPEKQKPAANRQRQYNKPYIEDDN